MKIEELHRIFLNTNGVVTDTRKIEKNTIFFALKGANFNGNQFAKDALDKGADYAVIDEKEFQISEKTILVEDVLKSLQQLANHHRSFLKLPIISLTGSNGKTTTKELINAVLSKKFNTVATKGNLNNHIGVPLTLLSMDKSTEIGIVEMGANHLKEIESLCKITHPDFGYITNFGKAHLEGFGNIEGVIQGKSELYDHLISNNKTIFYNSDDPIQTEKLKNYEKKFGFSTTNNGDVEIHLDKTAPFVCITAQGASINSRLIGSYNFTNIAAAVAIGLYFNIPMTKIKEAIRDYTPTNNRSQILNTEKHKIVMDAYNANPSSMKVALENFKAMNGDNKVIILGDMFELGSESEKEHQNIAELAIAMNFEKVLLIGENFYRTKTSASKFNSFEELKNYLVKNPLPNDSAILIKGSRGMALERVLDCL
ncbi:UDP-N-acetylmuramoyl-tripeptide--D-alanyl-D-alanine ligase [Galbibacter sp. EGI 63066]|uniref:UDP-N-acetylmuramoyl-tripeptide--D-alanyl-D- alanine ligase n=1 Tax=Galbibacter sp. EGI 63066 TaxID=2993559 RepID=UPI002248D23E|nr:UDP-N-acetylmuramoyl-tripeptide--D-alanyl-D-alanine ligase [Galbibacter sp. EGI 63066]MCX2679663.1 UDP-N-acetylmuramoyl-tripeptide--D-alanyl-D-alanine ligase [Galbibacter sp. EGI 63066]